MASDAPEVAALISSLAELSWPILVALTLWLLRRQLRELAANAVHWLSHATEIEIGGIKIKGTLIPLGKKAPMELRGDVIVTPATDGDQKLRAQEYRRTQNLLLVHTVKPTHPPAFVDGQRVYDVSIYLHPHKDGKINAVEEVTYYLGHYWGQPPYGSKYTVRSGNEQFALAAQIYGPSLCIAKIKLHDGAEATVSRYIDLEMAPVYARQ